MENGNLKGLATAIAARDAEVYRLRAALERCVQALETCDATGAPHQTHDAVIASLAKVAGHGDMMRAIVDAWRIELLSVHGGTSPRLNHFTVGPTRDTLVNALRVGRAALEPKP